MHRLVLDLRRHRPWVYWLDLLASASVFWVGVSVLALQPITWLVALFLFISSGLALYRAALFVHEIGHFTHGAVPGFEFAWNAMVGWPLLFPSFFIQSHRDHHRVASFGTVNDPEYLPFAAMPNKMKVWFVVGSALTPLLLLLRAAFIVPISWIWRPLRQWLRLHASRMRMNGNYRPAMNTQRLTPLHEASEIVTSFVAWGWVVAIGFAFVSWQLAIAVLGCAMFANALNAWRTLLAHTYESSGQATDIIGQMKDSFTFDVPAWVGELLAPVGQRFHAAHHFFPYLPYHSLPLAHKRLIASDWKERPIYIATLRGAILGPLHLELESDSN
jgi:fatty acid desaturase